MQYVACNRIVFGDQSQELHQKFTQPGDVAPLVASPPMNPAAIFEALAHVSNTRVSAGAEEPYHLVQSNLILGNVDDIITLLSQLVAQPYVSSCMDSIQF